MKHKEGELTRFGKLLITTYAAILIHEFGLKEIVGDKLELCENFLLYLQSKNLTIRPNFRKEISNITTKPTEKQDLEAFYIYIESLFNCKG